MWNLPPPPNFQGLRDDLPLEVYVRHMPHWRQSGATYFVTFRLADSLPESRLHELAALKADWERKYPEPRPKSVLEQLARMVFERVEHWLDEGCGACPLRRPQSAAQITTAMHHFDGQRYELGCYVVMPNHVHAIVRPTDPEAQPLEMILKSWKSYSGRRINELDCRSGELWQEESHDRIIRDAEHLWRTIQYIGCNPESAGLAKGSCPRWIRPEWVALGWNFDS
jgi:REP element-mobilizing transposase RayT